MVLHLPHSEGDFGVSFNCVTKDTAFYTTTSRFVSWMGVFSQVRQELWMIFGTRPHGHLPLLCSFVIFTPNSLTSTTVKRSVCRLHHRSTEELVIDRTPKMVSLRTHRRNESWSTSLWQTFFSTSMGPQIPVIEEKSLVVCGCRKFQVDAQGHHLCQEVSRLGGWSTCWLFSHNTKS